ncbi:MAG: amidohydrolase [Fibrobacter sp.]|nr:amidohydrolase [Fibrobacter sp.]
MSKIVLKSVMFQGQVRDILISGKRFSKVVRPLTSKDYDKAEIVDCSGLAILPPFYNGHCHAAMTLLRGYADDMPLQEWLQNHIWPFEGKMTPKDIEIGSRLAVLEMIKSGTVFFADMYWHREQTMKVVKEMGIRASIGVTFAQGLMTDEAIENNFKFIKDHKFESDRVKLAVMPHSIYMVGEDLFKRCAKIAREEEMILHTHLSETAKEVKDCKKKDGCSPVELMARYGVLGDNFVAAHCVHLSEQDMALMAESGSAAVLNPCSNLKLNSGIPKIPKMLDSGMLVALGTDGASSNNNLDMHEEMKVASLLAKALGKADTLNADDVLKMATASGATAYGVEAGVIAEGFLADALLVDLRNERLNPCHNLVSNWVYAADSRAIHSVICDGKFVMKNRHIDGEEDIVREAEACAKSIASRC